MNVYKVHYVAYFEGIEWGDNIFVRAKNAKEAKKKAQQEISEYCDFFDNLESQRILPKDLPILQKYFFSANI